MPSKALLSSRYKQDYRSLRQEQVTDSFLAARDVRAQAQRDFILANRVDWRARSDLDVMDVGCAAGSLLSAFSSKARTLTGFEPDGRMASAARDRLASRAEIHNRLLDAPAPGATRYDLVCMSHALEHMCDPVETLRQLFGFCKEGAVVFLEVPNESGSTVEILCNRGRLGVFHLLFFQRDNIVRCIERAGGDTLKIGTFGDDLEPPALLAPGGMRRLAGAIARRLFRGKHAELSRLHRVMNYENPRGGAWLRCLCAPESPEARSCLPLIFLQQSIPCGRMSGYERAWMCLPH
jgi:SAM-dependent methyltransferase